MLEISSPLRICIRAYLRVSEYCSLFSRPFFLAAFSSGMKRARLDASCFFCCALRGCVGDKALAIFSNSARVITVLHSVAGVLAAEADLAAAPAAAATLGRGGQTPSTVITGASMGTA